jgi:dynein heavy chain 1
LKNQVLLSAYQTIESKLDEVQTYVSVWLQYQALWDLDTSAVYGQLGEDLARWESVLVEIRKARSTFDTTETEKSFGSIIIDYEQVQSKVGTKYDNWQREILNAFGTKLGLRMREVHQAISKSRYELEQMSPFDGGSTSETVKFITFIQDLRTKMAVWKGLVDVFKSGEKILDRQRYPFPSDWLYVEAVSAEWDAFNNIFSRKNTILETQLGTSITFSNWFSIHRSWITSQNYRGGQTCSAKDWQCHCGLGNRQTSTRKPFVCHCFGNLVGFRAKNVETER